MLSSASRSIPAALGVGAALAVLAGAVPARAADTAPPVITHTPVLTADRGENLTISAQIQDESDIFGATLWYRPVGSQTFLSAELTHKGDMWFATIPINSDVEYYIEAYDEFGNGPARAGSPENPYLIKAVGGTAAPAVAPQAQPTQAQPTPAQPSDTSPVGTEAEPSAPTPQVQTPKADKTEEGTDWGDAYQFHSKQPGTSPTAPPVTKPTTPYYQEWWFGTSIGVVGAGAVTLLVYFLVPRPVDRNVLSATVRPE